MGPRLPTGGLGNTLYLGSSLETSRTSYAGFEESRVQKVIIELEASQSDRRQDSSFKVPWSSAIPLRDVLNPFLLHVMSRPRQHPGIGASKIHVRVMLRTSQAIFTIATEDTIADDALAARVSTGNTKSGS